MIAVRAQRRCSAKGRRGATASVATAGLGLIGWIASVGVHATVLAVLVAWGGPAPPTLMTGAITVDLVVADGAESERSEAQGPADHAFDRAAAAPPAPAAPVAGQEPARDPAPSSAPAAPDDTRESSTGPTPSLLAMVTPPRKPPVAAPPDTVPPPAVAITPEHGLAGWNRPPSPFPLPPPVAGGEGCAGLARRCDAPYPELGEGGDDTFAKHALAGAIGRAAAAPRADNPKPIYPPYARRRGIEGRVVLRVEVTAHGTAGAIAVVESSRHDALDAAAIKAVRHWRFHPAERDGAAVPSRVQVPVLFRLTE